MSRSSHDISFDNKKSHSLRTVAFVILWGFHPNRQNLQFGEIDNWQLHILYSQRQINRPQLSIQFHGVAQVAASATCVPRVQEAHGD